MTNFAPTTANTASLESLFRQTIIANILRRTSYATPYEERPTVAQLDRMSTARLERINRATY